MLTECEFATKCEASCTMGRSLPRVRCFEELIILTFQRSEICTLIHFPWFKTSSILLLRPLSNDPRFIQCIYRYSHASKRFVEVVSYGVILFLIVCKHFGPRSNPTSIGSSLCPNCLWECFVVAAKVVATYSMGRS